MNELSKGEQRLVRFIVVGYFALVTAAGVGWLQSIGALS